jgi:ubiquinone/menaquinone biosynthesis C-methylase UbiE
LLQKEAFVDTLGMDCMKIVSPGNSAKECVFRQLALRAGVGTFSVCDLACGSGSVWPAYLVDHPNVSYVGFDTDASAIHVAQEKCAHLPNATFRVADAQTLHADASSFDIVTAFSALEHVVRIDKFLDTVFALLKPSGRAYLNFDNGHFHSHDVKERLMVPVSQLLARVGIEGPYMKEVDDAEVLRMIRERGGEIVGTWKHNMPALKKMAKTHKAPAVLEAWFAFEDRLNEVLTPEQLSPLMGSTTIVMQRV